MKKNIISSKNNRNLVGCITDSVTGLYLLSKDSLDKSEADSLLFASGIMNKIKTKEISGNQIFSQTLPEKANIKVHEGPITDSALGVEEGEMVKNDLKSDSRVVEAPLLSNELKEIQKGDALKRNLIRHDSQKLANELMKIVDSF